MARERTTPDRPMGMFGMDALTTAIVVANLAIFVWEVVASRSVDALVNVPPRVWLAFGANDAPLTLGLGEYERLLASCFVHGSILHVGLNMWSLGQIGPFVERTAGSARYAVLYVLSGIVASATSVAWGLARGAPVPSVGASGAICGVLGAAFVLGVRLEGWKSELARQIGFWLVTILAYGAAVKNVDNAAHVGGLVAGCTIAVLWRRGTVYSTAATVACVGISAALCLGAGAATAYRDVTDPFANLGPNDRSELVGDLLADGDCPGARRALAATEDVVKDKMTPELRGLRIHVENACREGAASGGSGRPTPFGLTPR